MNSSLDLVGGIEYSYRNLNGSKNNIVVSSRNDVESGKLNWRFGFNYNKKILSKVFLKTGLRLASIGYKGEKFTGLRWGSEHDGMGGWTPDPTLPHEIQISYDYWVLEVPVIGRYEFKRERFTPFIEVGISPYLFLTSRKTTVTDIGRGSEFVAIKTEGFNKIQLVGSVSFGANFKLNDNLQLFGQPIYRYHLTQLINGTITEFLYNAGIEIGVRKLIGKKP